MSDLPSRALGHSGMKTSIVGLGCNNFGRRLDIHATRQVVDSAIDAGVTFDTETPDTLETVRRIGPDGTVYPFVLDHR